MDADIRIAAREVSNGMVGAWRLAKALLLPVMSVTSAVTTLEALHTGDKIGAIGHGAIATVAVAGTFLFGRRSFADVAAFLRHGPG